jgi:RNA-directed DNA polymerase
MQPLDPQVHYGITDRDFLDVHDVQMDLLPDKQHQLRWKLNQKAKNEPKFRFCALYDRIFRRDVLEAAWKHVGKKGKAAGIDGVVAEDILAQENGVENFLTNLQEADFLDCSHGFRRGRKAHDALDEIRTNLKDGRTAVYDADLKGYFDTIPHDSRSAAETDSHRLPAG